MIYKADNLLQLPHITHGFFTRRGGMSTGPFESLNCGALAEDPQAMGNRNRVAEYLGLRHENLMSGNQQHTADVRTLAGGEDFKEVRTGPACDALMTKTPGIGLGILTADCVPILIAHNAQPLVAAVHAGWRGALNGILDSTITSLCQSAKSMDLVAAIGPSIQQKSYEVGPEVHEAFLKESAENKCFFVPSSQTHHFRLDLPGYVETKLKRLGLINVERFPHDTYENEGEFFSYRRNTHQGIQQYGRQISVIAIKGAGQ